MKLTRGSSPLLWLAVGLAVAVTLAPFVSYALNN